MREFLEYTLFNIHGHDVSTMNILVGVSLIGLLLFLYRKSNQNLLPLLKKNLTLDNRTKSQFKSILLWFMVFAIIYVVMLSLGLDFEFSVGNQHIISSAFIIRLLVIWQLVRALDWVINNVYLDYFYPKNSSAFSDFMVSPSKKRSNRKMLQRIFLVYLVLFIIHNFDLDYTIHSFPLKDGEVYNFQLSHIFRVIQVLLIAQLIIWSFVHLLLLKIYENRNLEIGSQFAINQLIKYVAYTFAVIYSLNIVGIDMTLILGGAAALLVGIGLGLQQTFNDLTSGIVLLFERSVSIGDVLEFDNTVGVVEKIGLRSSTLHTRDNVSMVVPNHLLINEKITNWTNLSGNIRFAVGVGVAYGSDTALVKSLLLESVEDHPKVLKYPNSFVRFSAFGDSSLNFTLYFFSKEYLTIEDIKSDIRLKIDALFRVNKITIPFPQRDVHIHKAD